MKEKIAQLWATKILNGERSIKEVPRSLLTEVKQAITTMVQ